jgi:hypothetical protein
MTGMRPGVALSASFSNTGLGGQRINTRLVAFSSSSSSSIYSSCSYV